MLISNKKILLQHRNTSISNIPIAWLLSTECLFLQLFHLDFFLFFILTRIQMLVNILSQNWLLVTFLFN